MADITKEELEKEIAKILKNANLAKTSTKKVIQRLEKDLGMDLTEKKKMIDKLVMDYVNSKGSEDESESDSAASADGDDKGKSSEDDYKEDEKKPTKRAAPAKRQTKKPTPSKRKAGLDEEDSENEDDNLQPDKEDSEWGKKKGAKAKKGGSGRGKGGGYTRAYKLSPALADLMGKKEMPRHEVVKRVWQIIKDKNLYDPNNKQFAICDDALYKVVGTKRFRCFGMMKYLKTHFLDE